MKRTTLNRSAGLAALALTMSLSLSACGSEDEPTTAADDTTSSETTEETPTPTEEETPMEEESEPAADDASAGTFGAGCASIPADGAGSFNGMATEQVATAASANPLLKTLVAAVTAADLGETLNAAEDITVFAPINDAFAAFPKKDLNALLKDKKTLTAVLTHHVVGGQMGPDELAGEFETLNGDMLTVEGSGEEFTVDGNAAVLCGNIQTANATVYVIDSVLMPS